MKAPNSGGPEMLGQYLDGTFKWNLKIKPELSLRQGLSAGSGVSRFDARLGNVKPFEYLNPFTGTRGKEIQFGRHIPLEVDLWIK